MDLRKSAMYLLIVMLSVNAWCLMLYEVDIGPVKVEPGWEQDSMEENLDLNATLQEYTWDVAYSDFVFGLLRWLGVVWGLIAGFPNLLSSAGVPSFIVDPLYVIWSFIWFTVGLLYYIGGREA